MNIDAMTNEEIAVKVSILEKGKDLLWNSFINHKEGSTIYHSLNWRDVFENSFGYKSFYLVATDSSGRICGAFPLFLVNGFKRRLVSVPFRDRGGPIADRDDIIIMLLDECIRLAKKLTCHYVEIKTLEGFDREVKSTIQYREIFYWINSRTELYCGIDQLWEKIKITARNKVRQAERAGLNFMDCSMKEDYIREYYKIYLNTSKKLGIPAFKLKFFQNIYKYIISKNEGKLFMVSRKDKFMSGAILFTHKDTVIYGYSSSMPESLSFRANDFMLWNSIKWAIDNNYSIFDFGSDSPLQDSLLLFKKKWNAIQKKVPFYYYPGQNYNIQQMDSSLNKYQIFRNIYKRLPMPIFRLCGGIAVKYFG